MREIPYFRVNAFTDRPGGGNPAGVVLEAEGLPAAAMQVIAAQLGMSETAFVTRSPGGADYRVRFFTPVCEIDLCGHATIATFFTMAARGMVPVTGLKTQVLQETNAGKLPVIIHWQGKQVDRVMMVQTRPRFLRTLDSAAGLAELARLLGAEPFWFKVPGAPVQAVSTGVPDLLLPVVNRPKLYALRPDQEALGEYCRRHNLVSIHAFALDPVEKGHAVNCRDFAPAVGIPEESATGTANGALGAYLVENRLIKATPPTTRFVSEQGDAMGRPSRITVEVDGAPGKITAVRAGGRAVVVEENKLTII
ncbi:MAG: PhzF family phenazine biosynthesis protein [Bacillota bacterium]